MLFRSMANDPSPMGGEVEVIYLSFCRINWQLAVVQDGVMEPLTTITLLDTELFDISLPIRQFANPPTRCGCPRSAHLHIKSIHLLLSTSHTPTSSSSDLQTSSSSIFKKVMTGKIFLGDLEDLLGKEDHLGNEENLLDQLSRMMKMGQS